jgi:hypothetical protein
MGRKCEEEGGWVEFKSTSSFIRFATPTGYENSRDLETLFVMPSNARNGNAQVVAALAQNGDVSPFI